MPPFTGLSRIQSMNGSVAPGTEHSRPPGSGYNSKVGMIESMTDTIGNREGYNAVNHSKEEWDCPLVSFAYEGTSTEYQSKLCTGYSIGQASPGSSSVLYNSTAPSLNLPDSDADASIRAANNMQFGVQDAPLNLPTFLGELREFRDLYRQTIGSFSFKSSISQYHKESFLTKISGQSVKEALRRMATVDLFNQFVLKPTLSDIDALKRTGGHIQAQVKRLYGGIPVRVVGTVHDVATSSDSFTTPVYQNTWGVDHQRDRWVTAYALVLYQPVSPLDAKLRAKLGTDALGFDKPLSSVWELTPFSWLVDYFIKVGDWLDGLQQDLLQVPYTVLEQGVSVKTVLRSEAWVRFDNPNHYASPKLANQVLCPLVKGSRKLTSYVRTPGPVPVDPALWPRLSLPSPRQAWNVLDLIYLKVFKSRS
jgi:hypothetical protein